MRPWSYPVCRKKRRRLTTASVYVDSAADNPITVCAVGDSLQGVRCMQPSPNRPPPSPEAPVQTGSRHARPHLPAIRMLQRKLYVKAKAEAIVSKRHSR